MKNREKYVRLFVAIIILIASGGGIVWCFTKGEINVMQLIAFLIIYFIASVAVCLNCITD